VVTYADPNSLAANSYRTVVAKLLYSIGKSMPSTFLLSSVGSQEDDDAAYTAINLGVAFAQAGHRVVIVDAQLRNPVLTRLFEANDKAGLYDLLTTKSSELRLVSVREMADMQFLPAGLSSEKWSGAMLNSTNIIKLVNQLQQEADIVLVAGPPASGFAESLTLASQVNGVILVARYGEAKSSVINEVVANLDAMNVQLVGVIFEQSQSPFASKRTSKKASAGTSVVSVGASQREHTTSAPAEKSNLP
jgi:capsular exopolysaccharide synthesis family protein